MYRLATVFGLASVRPPHRVYRVRLLLSECKSKQNYYSSISSQPDINAIILRKRLHAKELHHKPIVGQNYYYSTFASNNIPLSPHCRGEV